MPKKWETRPPPSPTGFGGSTSASGWHPELPPRNRVITRKHALVWCSGQSSEPFELGTGVQIPVPALHLPGWCSPAIIGPCHGLDAGSNPVPGVRGRRESPRNRPDTSHGAHGRSPKGTPRGSRAVEGDGGVRLPCRVWPGAPQGLTGPFPSPHGGFPPSIGETRVPYRGLWRQRVAPETANRGIGDLSFERERGWLPRINSPRVIGSERTQSCGVAAKHQSLWSSGPRFESAQDYQVSIRLAANHQKEKLRWTAVQSRSEPSSRLPPETARQCVHSQEPCDNRLPPELGTDMTHCRDLPCWCSGLSSTPVTGRTRVQISHRACTTVSRTIVYRP